MSGIRTSRRNFEPTHAFWQWFGGSKVVDSNGNPLIVYKGMYPYDYNQETEDGPAGPAIDVIQRSEPFPSFDSNDQEPVRIAGFFTDNPDVAGKFVLRKGAIFPVYLRIENPKIFDAAGSPSGTIQFGKEGRPFRDAIRSGKYDGVIILNTSDEGNVYVPLSSNQIKSALASESFNREDPRITAKNWLRRIIT